MTIPLLLEHNSSTQIVFDDFKGLNDWTNNIKSPVIKILPYCTVSTYIQYSGLIKIKTILSNKISFLGLRFKTEYIGFRILIYQNEKPDPDPCKNDIDPEPWWKLQ